MKHSESIKEIAEAISAFQGKTKPLILDRDVSVKMSTGGTYDFSYATFKNIVSSCRDRLAENGLSISQLVGDGGAVTTILMHKSGEYLMTEPFIISPVKKTPQAIGSAISYAKRYSYSAILGLVTDSDDDANIAEENVYETVDRVAAGTNYNQGDIQDRLDFVEAYDKDPK